MSSEGLELCKGLTSSLSDGGETGDYALEKKGILHIPCLNK